MSNEVEWYCSMCGERNIDLYDETATPICGGCEQEREWEWDEISPIKPEQDAINKATGETE